MNNALQSAMRRSLQTVLAGDPAAATEALQTALRGGLGEPEPEVHTASAGTGRRGPVGQSLREALAGLKSFPRSPAAKQQSDPHLDNMPDGTRFERHRFVCNHGARDYWLYVPASRPDQPLGVVVMLHGCTQDALDFAAGTRMNEEAERRGFAVIYPEQPRGENASSCWNWFRPSDQKAGQGEPAILAALAEKIASDLGAEKGQVFAAGLSAGGAMAAILGDAYPDVFAAIGIHSGLAAGSAQDMPGAFRAMQGNGAAETRPLRCPAIIFHGASDATVAPVNAERIAGPLTRAETRTVTEGGRQVTAVFGRSASGHQVERWMIEGAGHAWSGGSRAGSYTDPAGPCATSEMMRFFCRRLS
jgi:poly(hydroxyalkanoate) depolymerase family esterase